MDVSAVGKNMLDAAAAAAGSTWTTIQHDFVSDIGNVLRNGAKIEAQLIAGELTPLEAETLVRNQSEVLFILTQEAIVSGQVVAQNAINAAIDVLWAAIKTAAKIP
jgi:hypothetical protein